MSDNNDYVQIDHKSYEKLEHSDKVYLTVPKGTGVKERYIVKQGDKDFSYADRKKGSNGKMIDNETGKPANGILKVYYKSGPLREEAILIDGVPQGRVYMYHDNGNLAEAKKLINGKAAPFGLDVIYSYEGKVVEVLYSEFINGNAINAPIVRYRYDEAHPEGQIVYEVF